MCGVKILLQQIGIQSHSVCDEAREKGEYDVICASIVLIYHHRVQFFFLFYLL